MSDLNYKFVTEYWQYNKLSTQKWSDLFWWQLKANKLRNIKKSNRIYNRGKLCKNRYITQKFRDFSKVNQFLILTLFLLSFDHETRHKGFYTAFYCILIFILSKMKICFGDFIGGTDVDTKNFGIFFWRRKNLRTESRMSQLSTITKTKTQKNS